MPDTFIADISNYQNPNLAAYQAAGYEVLINEVSWGLATTVPAGRIAAIRAQNFALVGWYMGLVANQPIAAQVAVFAAAIRTLELNEWIIIDWESTSGIGLPSPAQRDECRALLAQEFDRPVMVYGGASDLRSAPPGGEVWAASYETSEPDIPHLMWQFSDGTYVSPPYSPINFPGIGFCDASVFHGTVAQLQMALGLGAPVSARPDLWSLALV